MPYPDDAQEAQARKPDYEPPTIVRLGTLAELTLGPSDGTDDAVGGFNGGGGSI